MNALRWLHLSDFHTGKDSYGQNRLFNYLIERVKSRVASDLAPHIVFITGDIANKGQSSQYKEFNEGFLLPLIDVLPIETRNRVYLIPGNHDVDRSQTRAVQTYDVLLRIPEFLDPTLQGQVERQHAVFPRFHAFASSDITYKGDHWLFSPEGNFKKTFSFNNKRIGILGINTAWLSCSDFDRHQLSAGKGMLEDGLMSLVDCDYRFVLGHHPLDWFGDWEVEPVRALLGRYNAIYLHGHMHKGRSRFEEGAGYPFLTIQSGACFQTREDEQWVNRFLSCELDFNTHEISVEPLQWSRDHQEWVLDSLAFPEKYRKGSNWILSLPFQPAREGKKEVTIKENVAARVFLCHSKSDKLTVRKVYEELKKAGLQPWMDEEDILPGQDWEYEIEKAIRNTDYFLAFLSNSSIDKRGYVQKEINLALDVLDKVPEGKVYLIPVRLEECDVPDRLRKRQWVDLFSDDGLKRIIKVMA